MSRPPFPPLPPSSLPPPRAERNALERRSVTVTRAGLPADALHEQHVVPRNSLFIDLLVWGAAADSPVWVPFRPFFAGRRVAVEFCSGHLSLDMLNSYFAKAQLVNPEGTLPGEARLFILCNQRPEARLRELARFVTPGPVAGSWCIDLGAAGQAIIAVATELPVQPGTTVLRLTAPKTSHAEHFQRLEDILTDPTLSDKLKRIILKEERMLNRDHTDVSVVEEVDREVDNLLVQFEKWKVKERIRLRAEGKAEGVAQGVAQGVTQGVDKAVEELLAAAAAYLPPETIEVLRKQRDPVAIALAMAGAAR